MIDYERVNRLKRKSIWWATASVMVWVVFTVIAYTPITKLVARQFSVPRPLLTVIRQLARQNQALGVYATAVRIDDEQAEKCNAPNLHAPWIRGNIYTPVPTFSEFIISERRQVVCLAIYEQPNADSLKDKSALVEIQKGDYAAFFGHVPERAKMFRLALVSYSLGEMDLDKIIRADARPGLRNFYHDIPRLFPVQKDRDGLQFREAEESHYLLWLKDIRDELERPGRVVGVIFLFTGFQGTILLVGCFLLMWKLYIQYSGDMREQELPVAKFRYFVLADDVAALTEQLLESRRRLIWADNERRRLDRQNRRQLREEQQDALTVFPQAGETPEQRQQRRRQKIVNWCTQLREITPFYPPSEAAETERICSAALTLFSLNFDEARAFLARAIDDRKRRNIEQRFTL